MFVNSKIRSDVIILSFLLFFLAGCIKLHNSQIEKKSDVMMQEGIELAQEGKLEKSLEVFNKAINNDPDNCHLLNNRGIILQHLGRYEDALKDYDKAISLCNSDPKFFQNKGSLYQQKEEFEKAVEMYDKAIDLNDKNALSYFGRGMTYAYLKKDDKALEDAISGLEIEPNHFLGHFIKGRVFFDKKDYKNARKELLKSIEIQPMAISYFLFGQCDEEMKNLNGALKYYKKALELGKIEPTLSRDLKEMGVIEERIKRIEDGLKDK